MRRRGTLELLILIASVVLSVVAFYTYLRAENTDIKVFRDAATGMRGAIDDTTKIALKAQDQSSAAIEDQKSFAATTAPMLADLNARVSALERFSGHPLKVEPIQVKILYKQSPTVPAADGQKKSETPLLKRAGIVPKSRMNQ